MGRQPESKSNVRKISKMGKYTYFVTIPKRDIDELGWKEKQKVEVIRRGDEFIIRDWKPSK